MIWLRCSGVISLLQVDLVGQIMSETNVKHTPPGPRARLEPPLLRDEDGVLKLRDLLPCCKEGMGAAPAMAWVCECA